MKIYVDLIFILNFMFDLMLLLTVSIILSRHVKFYRFVIGALLGGISIFYLFIQMNSFQLFILKVIMSILMIIATFGYHNIKYTIKNLGILYMSSIILGGFLYFLNVQFSYKQEGLVFYHHGTSINFVFLLIISPIILYIYIKQSKKIKMNYSYYHLIKIYFQNKIYNLTAFLDTGNQLTTPFSNKAVILINPNILKKIDSYFYLPVSSVNEPELLKCIKIDKIEIEGIGEKKNIYAAISKNKIAFDGVDCILNYHIMEELKWLIKLKKY